MDKIKLKDHVKKGDTFYTFFTNPDELGQALNLSSWSREKLPDYIWLALIIDRLGRKWVWSSYIWLQKSLQHMTWRCQISRVLFLWMKKEGG